MRRIESYDHLDEFGRQRLSRNFFMREFLQTEIGAWFGIQNVPEHPDLALAVGTRLCTELLEPLQDIFGKIHVRSGYRSTRLNAIGNEHKLNCASNEKNFAGHIWDYPDANGHFGATACVVVPVLIDYIESGGSWTAMAWWIHDHLSYNSLCFFAKQGAFNINWHEQPTREISSYTMPKGTLTRPGMANHAGLHAEHYAELLRYVTGDAKASLISTSESVPVETSTVDISSHTNTSTGSVLYRAVHTKTAWRKVNTHTSLNNAIYGKNGAAALFAGTVRIDYERHGHPKFVVVWEEGAQEGHVVRASNSSPSGVEVVTIPISAISFLDGEGGCADDCLFARYFEAIPAEK